MFFLNLSFKHSAKWKNSHIFGTRCNTGHIFWSNRQSMHIELENWSGVIGIVHSKDCYLSTFYHIQNILKFIFFANMTANTFICLQLFALIWVFLSTQSVMFVALPYWFLHISLKKFYDDSYTLLILKSLCQRSHIYFRTWFPDDINFLKL